MLLDLRSSSYSYEHTSVLSLKSGLTARQAALLNKLKSDYGI